jgi:hypothetical protein
MGDPYGDVWIVKWLLAPDDCSAILAIARPRDLLRRSDVPARPRVGGSPLRESALDARERSTTDLDAPWC